MDNRSCLAFTRKERWGISGLIIILISITVIPELIRAYRPVPSSDISFVNGAPALEPALSIPAMPDTGVLLQPPDIKPVHNGRMNKSPAAHLPDHYYKQAPARTSRASPGTSGYYGPPKPIEINTADTTEWIALPGIGSKLATRIVLFRSRLGGFYDIRQLGEVYGLKDSVLRLLQPFLLCNPSLIRKIPINTATPEELAAHPYLRWSNSKALVRYRDQHGGFADLAEILRMDNIDPEAMQKTAPYLTFR